MNTRGYTIYALLLCIVLVNAKYFKFQDCSRENGIAKASMFQVSPDPVRMKNNVTVNMDLKVLRDVPEEAVLKTWYYKIQSVFGVEFDVPIPCLLGKFGSCTMSLCKYMATFKDQLENFMPPDKEYGCPLAAGDYGGKNIQVPMPYIPPIARIIVGGKYRAEVKLLDRPGGKELACYKLWMEVL